MKYYVYLSDSKIEMLYNQIDHSTDEVREASIGFDVKVLKGELKSGRKLSTSKYKQLESVISELQSSDLVGNIWSGKPYISATLTMIWASFGGYFRDDEKPAPITFWGYTDEHIALGLAGSSYHVLGQTRPDGYAHSHSGTEAIASWLIRNLNDSPTEGLEEPDKSEEFSLTGGPLDSDDVSNCIWLAASQAKGTSHRFEFVAKVLNRSRFDPSAHHYRTTNVLLATPLYVARLD